MKKVNLIIIMILFFFLVHADVNAARIFPHIAEVVIEKESVLYVSYFIDPQGEKIYTVNLDISFPPSLMQLSSFNFMPEWTILPVPEHDLVDNKNGRLVKTAGYKNGISELKQVGDAYFKIIKSGNGVISLEKSSIVLNQEPKNVLNFVGFKSAEIQSSVPDEITQNLNIELDNKDKVIKPNPKVSKDVLVNVIEKKIKIDKPKKATSGKIIDGRVIDEQEFLSCPEYFSPSKLECEAKETKSEKELSTFELFKMLISRLIWPIVAILFLSLSIVFMALWLRERKNRFKNY